MIELKAWMDQLKKDDPETARILAQTCHDESGSLFSTEGVRCMRRKYDEGVRA